MGAHRILTLVTTSTLVVGLAGSASAQISPDLPQPSVKAKVEQRVGVTDFSVEYASPAVKGRTIWGGLVAYDQLWRTGANAATKLVASRAFEVGGTEVPAGTYAVYAIPGKDSWTVILNSHWNTSGTHGYDQKNDVARVTVKPEAVPHRERLTFIFSDSTDDTARLDLEWEKLRVSVPLKVKTKDHVLANIKQATDEAWRPHFLAARWHLDNGGNLDEALGFIDTSIGIRGTWWNHWVKAQLLAKKGKSKDAVAAAEKAQSLGKGDRIFEGFFQKDVAVAITDWKKKKG